MPFKPGKINLKPGNMLNPSPVVMVSCGNSPDEYNIITVAWTGTICSDPPMCYISVRPERHSHDIIKRNGEFVINLATERLAFATDWCGVRSGRKFNKFIEMNLTPVKGKIVQAPLIYESPVNIECVVKDIVSLGSHDMFIAEVVAVNASEFLLDKNSKILQLEKCNLLSYSHGQYYVLGKRIGKFGFSVEKKK